MTRETEKKRNGETTDVWEAALTRRLADDLDAFLASADDETFLFVDETPATRRISRSDKRLRLNALATVAASLAILVGVAATTRVYIASPQTKIGDKASQSNDEPSLIAWSVESFNRADWARRVETKLTNSDVFGLGVSLETESTKEGAETAALAVVAEAGGSAEDGATEAVSNEWFSVGKFADVAALEPLKYEPFLQAVAASLR